MNFSADLAEVVRQTHQGPFAGDLGQTAETKLAKFLRFFDDPEDRFHLTLSSPINRIAGFGTHLGLHGIAEIVIGAAGNDFLGLLRRKALCFERTRATGGAMGLIDVHRSRNAAPHRFAAGARSGQTLVGRALIALRLGIIGKLAFAEEWVARHLTPLVGTGGNIGVDVVVVHGGDVVRRKIPRVTDQLVKLLTPPSSGRRRRPWGPVLACHADGRTGWLQQ